MRSQSDRGNGLRFIPRLTTMLFKSLLQKGPSFIIKQYTYTSPADYTRAIGSNLLWEKSTYFDHHQFNSFSIEHHSTLVELILIKPLFYSIAKGH